MTLNLERLDRAKTYELVVRQLKKEIYAGRLEPGDRLPGERDLSELLGVSRPSVREAIRTMQALQVVQSRPGAGASSGLIVSTQPRKALEDLLGLHLALASYSTAEVMSIRLVLECQVVEELVESGVTSVPAAEETLEMLANPRLNRSEFHDLDAEFHVALAHSTGNRLLSDLMTAIREAVRKMMDVSFEAAGVWPDQRSEFVQEHVDIYDAIVQGEKDRATSLVDEHIAGFFDTFPSLRSSS